MTLNHITLVVSDIEKSKEFYEKYLNLKPTFQANIGGPFYSKIIGKENVNLIFSALKIPGSNVIIELAQFIDPKTKINPDFRHIAFEVDDVDKIYKTLKDNNIDTVSEPVTIQEKNPKIDGKRMFYFKDPDGNLIELFNKRENLYSNT